MLKEIVLVDQSNRTKKTKVRIKTCQNCIVITQNDLAEICIDFVDGKLVIAAFAPGTDASLFEQIELGKEQVEIANHPEFDPGPALHI
jgi:recombinational DNA repair protein RecR